MDLQFLPLGSSWSIALAVLIGLIQVIALGTVPENRKPSSAMAWMILVILAPGFGFVAFMFLGAPWLDRRRHGRQERVLAEIADVTDTTPHQIPALGLTEELQGIAAMNRRLGSFPLQSGHSVELISDYHESMRRMAADIDTATDKVHVQFYIAAWDETTDPVFAALVRAKARGVKVRLQFDHLATVRIKGARTFFKRLREEGFDYHVLLPIQPWKGIIRRPDLRNHRKILIIDDRVAYTGSQNLIEPGYHKALGNPQRREWKELTGRFTGNTVLALDVIFIQDWYTETGERLTLDQEAAAEQEPEPDAVQGVMCQLVPSGPGYKQENNLRLFTALMYAADERISLTSPYFVPDESLLSALTTAAARGVEVELFVNEKADQFMVGHAQSSYYRALLEAGVRIWQYPMPAVLHSKHFTIDDRVAVIGSSNMDMRSFALNYETSIMMIGESIVATMRQVEDDYRAISKELTEEAWQERPYSRRYIDNVMRLTAGLQ